MFQLTEYGAALAVDMMNKYGAWAILLFSNEFVSRDSESEECINYTLESFIPEPTPGSDSPGGGGTAKVKGLLYG